MRSAPKSLRTVTTTLLILGAMAGSARANGPVNRGAVLRIVNRCDGAVEASVGDDAFVLEPGAQWSPVFANTTTSATLTVRLVGTSLTATKSCPLKSTQVTTATVTTDRSHTKLSIAVSKPGQLAGTFMGRETGVTLASSSGLAVLLGLSWLLGRSPSRRQLDRWLRQVAS